LPFLVWCISAARSGRSQVVDTDHDDVVDADGALAVRRCAVRRRRLEHVAGFAAVPPEHAVRAGEDVARVDVPVEGWVELGSDEGVGCRQSSPTPSPTSRELDQPLVPELCPLCRNFSPLCHYCPCPFVGVRAAVIPRMLTFPPSIMLASRPSWVSSHVGLCLRWPTSHRTTCEQLADSVWRSSRSSSRKCTASGIERPANWPAVRLPMSTTPRWSAVASSCRCPAADLSPATPPTITVPIEASLQFNIPLGV
jgi:hypothetical protein